MVLGNIDLCQFYFVCDVIGGELFTRNLKDQVLHTECSGFQCAVVRT